MGFLVAFLLSCSDDESSEIEKKSVIDPMLVGSWRHPNYPTGFTINESGTVTYLKVNQLTGKFVVDPGFEDKITAIDGKFEFLESSDCFIPEDSTYSFNNGNLEIPIGLNWQDYSTSYFPLEIESYEGKTRGESYVAGTIEIKAFWGDTTYNFSSSDEFELMEMFSAPNPGSFISAYDNPQFDCNLPYRFYNIISMITVSPVKNTGIYDLLEASVQVAGQEAGNTFNLTYDNTSAQFGSGKLSVLSYSEDSNSKLVEGDFEFYLTHEFNGSSDTIRVTSGKLKIYEYPD